VNPVAEVNGLSIAYQSAGEGPPLVLLHGFLCDSRCWRTQLDGLSDQFRVVAWDAPGAGASSDPPDRFTITGWADCLGGFLDAVGIDRAYILGLSWGGMLAQELYRLDPARAIGLILCDTYAGWKGSLSAEACEKRLGRCENDSLLSGEEFAPRWAPEMFTENAPRALVDEMSAIFREFHPHGFRLMAKSLADTDTTDLLPRIQVPTLLVWGDDDRRSPINIAEHFREVIPNAELVVIANAGHVSNMEQPDAFNAEVRRFCMSV
jgi:pimeloyl-ACP methyl ester carboxylesterase